MSSAYLRVLKWIDFQWTKSANAKALLLPPALVGLLATWLSDSTVVGLWVGRGLWVLIAAWIGVCFWRGFYWIKVSSRDAGKEYEKRGRYKLPPEDKDSEDAWMAARRRKNRMKR